MSCIPNIYGFPGFPTLPPKIATFSKLVHVVFSEIIKNVSICYCQDCLRKDKIIIFGILGGRNFTFLALFLKKVIFSAFRPQNAGQRALFAA